MPEFGESPEETKYDSSSETNIINRIRDAEDEVLRLDEELSPVFERVASDIIGDRDLKDEENELLGILLGDNPTDDADRIAILKVNNPEITQIFEQADTELQGKLSYFVSLKERIKSDKEASKEMIVQAAQQNLERLKRQFDYSKAAHDIQEAQDEDTALAAGAKLTTEILRLRSFELELARPDIDYDTTVSILKKINIERLLTDDEGLINEESNLNIENSEDKMEIEDMLSLISNNITSVKLHSAVESHIQAHKLTKPVNSNDIPTISVSNYLDIDFTIDRDKLVDALQHNPMALTALSTLVKSEREQLQKSGVKIFDREPTEDEVTEARKILTVGMDEIMADIREWNELYTQMNGEANALLRTFKTIDIVPGWTEDLIGYADPRIDILLSQKVLEAKKQLQMIGILPRSEVPKELKTHANEYTPEIIGLENKNGYTCITNRDAVIGLLHNTKLPSSVYPGFFLRNINSIDFTAEHDLAKILGDENLPEDPNHLVMHIAMEIDRTLAHEIMEHVHKNLSVDELREWKLVCEAEPESITPYVEYTLQEIGRDDANRESFADAGAMFRQNPQALRELSPKRFEYMKNLWLKYLPEDQADAFVEDLNKRMQTDGKNAAILQRNMTRKVTNKEIDTSNAITVGTRRNNFDLDQTGFIGSNITINISAYIPNSYLS